MGAFVSEVNCVLTDKCDKYIINNAINEKLQLASKTIDRDKTALLIGPSNSGKSTLLKQFYYTQQTQANELNTDIFGKQCLQNIRNNCIETIIILSKLIGDNVLYALAESLKTDTDLSNVSNVIRHIWESKLYKQTYFLRHSYTKQSDSDCIPLMPDNMDFFLDKISEIMTDTYVLTSQDLTLHKTSSVCINRYHGNIEGFNGLHLLDFGINPLQILPNHTTHKPLEYFANVDGIIYVSSLTDYCDGNKMEHSFKMFGALVRLKLFQKTKFSLVLSKYDLLKQMQKYGISLSEYFGNEWNMAKDYKNRKLPLTVHHLTRSVDGIHIPSDLTQLMIEFLVESEENEQLLNECTNNAAMFIKDKFVKIYNKYASVHDYPLNVDWYPNVCTNLEVMRASLWGIRCFLYEGKMSE